MGFFASVGPLSIFTSTHLLPLEFKFQPDSNPPEFASPDGQVSYLCYRCALSYSFRMYFRASSRTKRSDYELSEPESTQVKSLPLAAAKRTTSDHLIRPTHTTNIHISLYHRNHRSVMMKSIAITMLSSHEKFCMLGFNNFHLDFSPSSFLPPTFLVSTWMSLVPPWTSETAHKKVKAAQNLWNTKDADKVVVAYTDDTIWRNRDVFLKGTEEVRG
jgi:hypothetical protein